MKAASVRSTVFLLVVASFLTAPVPARAGAPPPTRLRIATFNIEYGGTVIDFDAIVAGVLRADADVVGVNEAYAHLARLARLTDYRYVDHRLDVMSRFPLIDPTPGGRYVYVRLSRGQVIAIANVHLPSGPYSPNRILRGATRREVIRIERDRRVPAIRPFVQALEPVAGAGVPTVILGDFNAPSFQDYTARTVGSRPQIRWPVAWPVSVLLHDRGYVDSYRAVFPNELAHPGITWPSDRPKTPDGWNPSPKAPRDRIDQIWVRNALPVTSQIVGTPTDPSVDLAVDPWGSDHREVVSTVDVTPAPPPVFVSAQPMLVDRGDAVRLRYHAPGAGGERLAVVPAGGDPVADALLAAPVPQPTDGRASFDTTGWTIGGYEALLLDSGSTVLARYPFSVRRPGAPPTLTLDQDRYTVGEPILVTWAGAPGWRWDWLGIYGRGADPNVAYYKDWLYTGATTYGSTTFDDAAHGGWPLPPGDYTMYYLRNDAYTAIAGVDFSVDG